jgi:hypothetical protein
MFSYDKRGTNFAPATFCLHFFTRASQGPGAGGGGDYMISLYRGIFFLFVPRPASDGV